VRLANRQFSAYQASEYTRQALAAARVVDGEELIMTGKTIDAALLPYFPADSMVGTPAYNKIAATNSMIDFFAKKDPSCVDRYFTTPYINHNMRAPDGLDPVHDLAKRAVDWNGVHTIVRREIADGDLVVLHSLYSNLLGIVGQRVAFDVFRFNADGKIVEHWDCLENALAPDLSGVSMIAGSVDIVDHDKTEFNRKIVTDFVEAVLITGNADAVASFVDTERLIGHSPARAPGLARNHGLFIADPAGPPVEYLQMHRTLAEGNFVLVQGEGCIGAEQVLEVYDLFRLDGGRIVEHWDLLQALAPRDQWANPNGPF
jgi:predicted SnoaL-like aldol condensation-catalyzing enzyme